MTTQATDPTPGGTTGPPPPTPPGAAFPPPTWTPPSTPTSPPWRDRLPELVGAIGLLLVVGATFGFLSATWEQLDGVGRGLVLAGGALGVTFVAVQLERRLRDGLASLVSMVWLAGTALLGSATLLLVAGATDTPSRVTAAVAGLVAAAHGAVALSRAPDRSLRQLGVVGGLLVAAGPFGTALTDRVDETLLVDLFRPIAGLLDPTFTAADFQLTGPAHLVIGLAWLLLGLRASGRAGRVAEVGATLLLGYAALELLVVPAPLGAFVALLVVLALLVHGLVTEQPGRIVAGAVLVLVCGGRVVWALFSGQVAVTVAALAVGLALLGWAVRARQLATDDAR
jgi:hypothetical protein